MKTKKILCLVIAVVMVALACPLSAFAGETDAKVSGVQSSAATDAQITTGVASIWYTKNDVDTKHADYNSLDAAFEGLRDLYAGPLADATIVDTNENGLSDELYAAAGSPVIKLNGNFHGNVNSLKLDNLVLGDGAETEATQTTFKAHLYSLAGTEPADCTTPAKNNYKCAKCDDTHSVVDNTPVEGHKWEDATCTAPKTCKVCGETEGDALPHDYAPATCTAPKTCKDCGATDGEKLAHDYNAATCTAPKTCKDCGATEGAKLAHDYNPATCVTKKTCKVCGATEGDFAAHSYGDWVETTKPTADKDGVETRTCSVCKDKETRSVEFVEEKNKLIVEDG